MNADERAAARARCDAATEGPWDHVDSAVSGPEFPIVVCQSRRDASFIAHARTDLPAALAALDAVEQERDALKRENVALRALYEFMWNEHGFTDAGDHPATTWEATARIEELCGAIEHAEVARQRLVSVEEGTK